MADAQKDLQIVFTTDTTEAEAGIESFTGTMDTLKSSLAGLGLFLVGQQLLQLGQNVIKSSADFQSSMEILQTQAGASTAEVQNMTQALLDMSSKVATTPEALAQGLYHIESAGYRGAQALDILKIAAEGAMVGHANLEDVTNALVGAVASGISGFNNMSQAMGILNAIVGSGNMRMQDLVSSLSSGILPVAKQFGLSIQDIGAALATLTDNGIPATDAATRLSHTISLIGAQTPAAVKELKSIGITQDELGNDMRNGGLLKALQDLQTHLVNSGKTATEQTDILTRSFGGGRNVAVLLTLLGNMDRVKTKYEEISGAADRFGSAWAETQATASYQIAQFQANLQKLEIEVGNKLLPIFSDALQLINKNIVAFAIFGTTITALVIPPLLAFALALTVKGVAALISFYTEGFKAISMLVIKAAQLALATAATIAHAVATGAVTLATNIWTAAQWLLNAALTANPIGIVIVLIAALAAGIIYAYTHSETFRNFVNKLWDALKSFGEFIVKVLTPAIHTIADAFDTVAKAAENAWNWMEKMAKSHGAKGVIIPGFAEGVTNFSGGMALVGENGPELVNLPAGSSVTPNSQTQQILNGKTSGGNTINITIQYPQLTSQQNVNQLIQDIKRALGRDAELAKLGAI